MGTRLDVHHMVQSTFIYHYYWSEHLQRPSSHALSHHEVLGRDQLPTELAETSEVHAVIEFEGH